MGLFNNILQKLGINKKDEAAPVAAPAKPVAAVPAKPAATAPAKPTAAPTMPAAPAEGKEELESVKSDKPVASVQAVSEVDVVKHLEELSQGKKLDWKVSIVDLLKLLELDSSFEARKELATELNCPADLMGDSAKMNTWLHKEVLKRVAANGGNIPKELLD